MVSLPSGETVETMFHDDTKQVRFRTVTEATPQESEKIEFQYDPSTQNLPDAQCRAESTQST